MLIRDAKHDDIPAIIVMGQRFFDASGYDDLTDYDEQSAAATFAMLIDSVDGVVLVAEHEGVVVGTAAALVFPFFFNHTHKHAQEFFWWVNDEARGAGVRLMKELEQKSCNLGAQSLTVAAVASLKAEAVGAVYRRAGFCASDSTYVKRLQSCL